MKVSIEGLRASPDGRFWLDLPRLEIQPRTCTAVLGPNGAGKTTLLRLLAGLEQPESGALRFLDGRGRPVPRPRVAYAMQEAVFVSGTVRRNLELALRLAGLSEPRLRARRAAAALGIEGILDRRARALSGGEAQRVNLARALALEAPLLLLDEPLAQVDAATRARLLDDLAERLGGSHATALVVTHDRDEALRLAERLVVLIDGKLRAQGTKREVFENPPDPDVARLLGHAVLRRGGECVAIPPGGLEPGAGAPGFLLRVRSCADLATHLEVSGVIDDEPVRLRLPPEARRPRPGEALIVHARRAVTLPPCSAAVRAAGSPAPADSAGPPGSS